MDENLGDQLLNVAKASGSDLNGFHDERIYGYACGYMASFVNELPLKLKLTKKQMKIFRENLNNAKAFQAYMKSK